MIPDHGLPADFFSLTILKNQSTFLPGQKGMAGHNLISPNQLRKNDSVAI